MAGLYFYLAAHYLYNRDVNNYYEQVYFYNSSGKSTLESWHEVSDNIELFFSAGGGTGFEIYLWRLSLSLMVGFAGNTDFNGASGLNLTGESGLHYKF